MLAAVTVELVLSHGMLTAVFEVEGACLDRNSLMETHDLGDTIFLMGLMGDYVTFLTVVGFVIQAELHRLVATST